MDAVKMRVGLLLRRGWKATVFLAVLAGLAGGVAMASWSLGRRASTALDRFLEWSEPRDLFISFCPPDMTFESMAVDVEKAFQECLAYVSTDEAAVLRDLPGVAAAGSVGYVGFTASPVDAPERLEPGLSVVSFDRGLDWPEGRPLMIHGRPPDPAAADEISINEQLADALGVTVGDEVDVHFWAPEETSYGAVPGERFTGPHVRARVVGIERNFRDLIAGVGSDASAIDEARITAGPGVAATLTDSGRWSAVLASVTDADAAAAALDEQFTGQIYVAEALLSPDDTEPAAEAIRFEARGTMLFGAITALAAAVFAGQAVSRQSRREWDDGATLRALGMSTQGAAGAALARGAVTGLLAVAVGTLAAVLLSLIGPFGFAAETEIDHAPVVDWLVLGVGAVTALLVVAVATCWPVVRQFRRHAAPAEGHGGRTGYLALRRHVSPPAATGLSMTFSGRGAGGLPTGMALTGLALAVTTGIVAVVLSVSLDSLLSTPRQFGVPWEVSLSTPIEAPAAETAGALEWLRDDPRVEAAAALRGTDVHIGDEIAWIQALAPIDGIDAVIPAVATSGRLPERADEIALGSVTMADHGISIGDEIEVTTAGPAPVTTTVTVVGTTVVNDTVENNAGRGGVVAADWIETHEPTVTPIHFVITLVPGTDVEQFTADLRSAAPGGTVQGPVPQGGIRNVERVRIVPFLLALLVGVLAVASLAHAIVLSVRRQRRQLAILKSLGFRTGQVRAAVAVACHGARGPGSSRRGASGDPRRALALARRCR